MKRLLFIAVLLPMFAWADIAPDDPATLPSAACLGQPEGATCGAGGRCVKQRVSRPDFSSGVPPKWKNVDVMICVEPAKSFAPFALLFLAMLAIISLSLGERGRGEGSH